MTLRGPRFVCVPLPGRYPALQRPILRADRRQTCRRLAGRRAKTQRASVRPAPSSGFNREVFVTFRWRYSRNSRKARPGAAPIPFTHRWLAMRCAANCRPARNPAACARPLRP